MSSLISATFWSAIQRFGGLAIGFVSNVVLARLLCPEDYGIIGLIMVFIGIADAMVDGGLGNALIQKKNVTRDDTSTVFTTNILFSFFLFLLIFFSAPAIEAYVNINKFSLYLRIEAVMILLRALYVVHYSMLNKDMDFQKLAKINLGVNAASTVIAILMAYSGFGVWSLIVRNLMLDLLAFIVYYLCYRTKLSLYISKESFRQLFGFGIFVAIANLLESLYSNLLSFILGKKFSVKELGYYNQAYSLEQIPVYSITSILNQVFFPFLSKEQDNRVKMREDVKRSIRVMSFFIYPLMIFLVCFAKPIIVLLYTEKWLPSVPFFQILCTIGFTNFLYHLNRSILKAVDKTQVLFYTQIVVCVVGLLFIMLAIPFGIYAVVVMVALNSVISSLIVMCFSGRHINLNIYCQIKEVLYNFILSGITGILAYIVFSDVNWNEFLLLPVAFVFFVIVYITTHYLLRTTSYKMISLLLMEYINKRIK